MVAPQPPSDPFAALTPEFALKALRKHWLLGLSAALAVFLAVAFRTFGATKIYQASATVQIDPTPPRPLGKDVQAVVDMGVGNFWSNQEYLATQQRLIQSRKVAVAAVKRLGLHRDRRFLANTPPAEADPPPEAGEATPDDAAGTLLSRVTVTPVKESWLVTVTYQDADPERAARVLAALVDAYLEHNVEQVVASTGSASDWLHDQVAKLKRELEASELQLHDYKKNKQILSVSLDDQSNMLRGEMQQLGQALTAVQTRKVALRARCDELAKIDPQDPNDIPATELLNNQLLSELRAEYVRLKAEHAAIVGAGKGERHPDVAAAAARIEPAREALLAEVRNVQGAARSDLDAATREAAGLSALLEQAKQRALDLNQLEMEYRRLERTKAQSEKLYGLVLERSKESDLTGLLRFNNISIAEPARASRAPIFPRTSRDLPIGLAAGLVLGFGLMLGRELLDRRVRTPEDLERATGVACFGLLPSARRGAASSRYRAARRGVAARGAEGTPIELMVHHAPGSVMAEAARQIRTNLLFSSPDRPHRRILVTSAGPGEGKTMVASTLAAALAQTGQRVLLVDCDLRRSRLHQVFGLSNDVGVTTGVMDHARGVAAPRATLVPNLSVLPAGPAVATPAELLHSDSFRALLDELGTRFDRIVLDSSPVALVTDAAILASLVDATLLVVRAGRTPRVLATRAVAVLGDVGVKVAGTVLNDVDLRRKKYGSGEFGYYGFGYGYGYGYGHGSDGSPDARPGLPA